MFFLKIFEKNIREDFYDFGDRPKNYSLLKKFLATALEPAPGAPRPAYFLLMFYAMITSLGPL
jgi:hypothetical protein